MFRSHNNCTMAHTIGDPHASLLIFLEGDPRSQLNPLAETVSENTRCIQAPVPAWTDLSASSHGTEVVRCRRKPQPATNNGDCQK